MELRGVLWALARICEFHLRLRLSLEHPHILIDCLKRHQVQAQLPQSKQCRIRTVL